MLLAPSAKRREVFGASRMKEVSCIPLRTTVEAAFVASYIPGINIVVWLTASNELICFLV